MTGDQKTPRPGRVAETEWRRSRAETFDTTTRRKVEVGRNANQAAGEPGAVGTAEWRQGTDGPRADMARAGSGSHNDSKTLGPLDSRSLERKAGDRQTDD